MPDVRVRRADLQLDDGQVGAGYAAVTPAAREAMRLAARTEGPVPRPPLYRHVLWPA